MTERWALRRDKLFLVPGDSPAGFRLPLTSTPVVGEVDYPHVLARDPSGLRFSISNARKDLDYYNAMAADAGAPKDIAAAVLATLEGALVSAGPEALVPELVSILGGGPRRD